MERVALDQEREERILDAIIVDAYGPEEQALGWYYYLDGMLRFPFRARCIVERVTSPVRPGEEVDVVRLASEAACEHDMIVLIRWNDRALGIPLSQLSGISIDEETQQAIEDWQYWTARGHEF